MRRPILAHIFLACLLPTTIFPDAKTDNVQRLKSLEELAASLSKVEKRPESLTKLPDVYKSVEDPEVKSLLLTCYALGQYAASNDAQASVVVQRLKTQHPDSPNLNYFYAGLYAVPCRACQATDQIHVKCNACQGSGHCTICAGRGRVKRIGDTYAACPTCKAAAGKCLQCKGKGTLPLACTACPSGYIVSRKRFEEAFRECSKALEDLALSKKNELLGFDPTPAKASVFLASAPKEVPMPRVVTEVKDETPLMAANQQALLTTGLLGLSVLFMMVEDALMPTYYDRWLY